MARNVTASLTLKLQTLGEAGLRSAIKDLDKTAVAAAKAGSQLEGTQQEVQRLGDKARPLRTLEKELLELGRRAEQTKIKMAAREIFHGPAGEPPIIPKLRSVEHEMARLQRQAENRAITQRAKAQLGGSPLLGGFFEGHGYLSGPRKVLGVMRDMTVAGMGVGFAVRTAVNTMEGIIEPARKFETSMADIRNKGGFTADQMKTIEAAARGINRAKGLETFKATDAAEAGVELAAAGLTASGVATALPVALKFSLASGMNKGESSELLADTMAQFNMVPKDLEKIGNVMVKTANMSTISTSQIGQTLKYVGPIAATAGVGFEQLNAMIGVLGSRGVKASEAGTGLRKILTSLAHPTKRTAEALRELGMSKKDMQEGIQNLPKFLGDLQDKMNAKGLSAGRKLELNTLLFGAEGLVAANVLGNNAADVDKFADALKSVDGEMQNAAATMANTLNGRIAATDAQFEALRINLTDKLKPALMGTFEAGAESLARMNRLLEATDDSASGLGQSLGNILFGTKEEREKKQREQESLEERTGVANAVAFGGDDSANPLVKLGSFLYGLNMLENDRQAENAPKNLEAAAKAEAEAKARAVDPRVQDEPFRVDGEIKVLIDDQRVRVVTTARSGPRLPVGGNVQ